MENLPKINLGISMFIIILCIILFVKVSNKVNLEESRKLKLKNVDITGMTKLKDVNISSGKLQLDNFTFAPDGSKELKLTNSLSTGDITFRIAPGSKISKDYGYADINIQQPKNSKYGNLKNGTDSDPGSCWVASRWGSACQNSKAS